MIGVLDYGLGNVNAFVNAYQLLNIPVRPISEVTDFEGIAKLILPGVGSFDWAMDRFTKSGLRELVEEQVFEKKTPLLGVCVGMQMLAKSSDEGTVEGLNWVGGDIKSLREMCLTAEDRVPHMGWNNVVPKNCSPLFEGFQSDIQFYFLHSYIFRSFFEDDVIGTSTYGEEFASAVSSDNIYGVQFHPEKSHAWGMKLLANFARNT